MSLQVNTFAPALCDRILRLLAVLTVVLLTEGTLAPQNATADSSKNDQLLVSKQAVEAVLAGSRDEIGTIRRITSEFGLFVPDYDAQRTEPDFFSRYFFSEIQLFGKVSAVSAYVIGKRYPYGDASNLVILRDFEEDKVRLLADIPQSRDTIEKHRAALSPASCGFFFTANPDRPDRIQTAYIFVGREATEVGDCLHRQLLRAFGIVERPIDGLSFADKFLSELVAVRIVAICASRDSDVRDTCYTEQLAGLR